MATWSDISPSFERAWNNDAAVVYDLKAIQNSMLGIILTRKGSKPFNPDFGCNLSKQLFENMNAFTGQQIQQAISEAITKYEPRVVIRAIDCKANFDRNSVAVTIEFSLTEDDSATATVYGFDISLDKNSY